MKNSTRLFAATAAALGLATGGCGKKPKADHALDEAIKALDQANTVQQSSPAVAPTPTTPANPAPVVPATTSVSQQMTQAVISYKAGQYVDAVTRLQWLRARKGNTPEQIMALQQATAAVMGEIYARAARGDPVAQKAVKEYERLQTAP